MVITVKMVQQNIAEYLTYPAFLSQRSDNEGYVFPKIDLTVRWALIIRETNTVTQDKDSNLCEFNAFKAENTNVLSRCEYNHGSKAVWLGWISRKGRFYFKNIYWTVYYRAFSAKFNLVTALVSFRIS